MMSWTTRTTTTLTTSTSDGLSRTAAREAGGDAQGFADRGGRATPNDRGAIYTLANGTTTSEAGAALLYALGLRGFLETRGAVVLTNDPARGILVGPYSTRHHAVNVWKAHAYLACHLNAGRGSYALMEHMSMTEGKVLGWAMGQALVDAFPLIVEHRVQALKSDDRGAVCIERVEAPCLAVLCEPFFGDNPRHQDLLAAPELKRLGEALGEGVASWWRSRAAARVTAPGA
jgi:hypothetical protein